MTTIDDLPDEILTRIFESVPLEARRKNRQNFMLVSKRWKYLADESMGLEIFVGASPWSAWEDAAGVDHLDVSRIQQVGISVCHVGELVELQGRPNGILEIVRSFWGKVKSLFVTPVFPKFKHPHLLQSLRFSGIIRDEYFHGIFQQPVVNHLHQLQMNHSSLSMLEATSLQGYVFEALEFIEIMADFTYIFRNIDDSRILTNVLSILRNRFPSLRTCNVYIPYNAGREIEITKTFFRFLHCVSRTLRCMEMFYFFMLSDEMEEDLDETTTTDDVDDPELDEITQVASGSLRLEIAMLHMNIDHLRCFSYWTRLLSQQRQLEYLVVLSEHQIFTPSLIRQISNNLRIILVNIDTRGTDGRATPLDCEIFQDCHHLSHFSIKGRFEDFILLFSTPGLVNVHFLPMSITHIDLSRIPVRSNDLHRVLLYMENLRHFTAKFVGRHGEMGATMDTLREVILRRRLHWLHLVGSINGEFPSGGLSNGHPSRPIALYMDEDAFCVKLNRTGYYGYASAFEELQASVLGRNR